jgi:1-aminocyclopropane-1-carboxylate deaminase
MLLTPQPTPVQVLHDPLLDHHGVRLLIKRTDLVHPIISGNKWYKLKYNLLAARQQGASTLLSFGGAYSNHIHALAGAGREYGFKTIGVIRGEPCEPLNPTLQFAVEQGMELHYLNRSDYRLKQSPQIIELLHQQFGGFYLVPEGGTNALAVRGCSEMVADVSDEFDVVACACGTGGTLAGVIAGLNGERHALGVAVLKGAAFLNDEVRRLLLESRGQQFNNWDIECDYHHGGYAKTTPELLAFMQRFEDVHGIPLDPVYTGKLLFALYEMIKQQRFTPGTTLLAIHSGGLQGRAGFGLN